ncbi:MAG: GFA family protein [Sphingomicrobium sp.]
MRFVAELPAEPVPALECNCSICSIAGFTHIIVSHDKLRLEQGVDVLTSYRFGTGAAEHLFCPHCGVKSFYQPRSHADCWSVNARCLDAPPRLEVEDFDGRNWGRARAALDEGDRRG